MAENAESIDLAESDFVKGIRTQKRSVNIYHEYEYAKNLVEIQSRINEYNIMRKSDAQIGGLLKVLKLPIRKAEWSIEGGREDIREFIEQNLKTGLKHPFEDFVRLVLTFMEFGFSVFEKVFMFDEASGYFKWKKFQFLPHATIYEIVGEEDGGLKEVQQFSASDMELGEAFAPNIKIPAKYCLIFVNDKEGDWYGTSVFRNAYGNYKIKDTLIKIDAIRHDRFGVGIPYMKMKMNYKKDDLVIAENVLQNMRSHEYMYMIIPPGVEGTVDEGFGIMSAEGTGTDIMKSIHYHDESMSKSVLAQFIDLGTSQSGNRALGQSFIDLYIASLNGYTGMIEQMMNKFAIRQLVDFNWGKQEEYPVLRFEEIKAADVVEIAPILKDLAESGWLTPNRDDENKIRIGLGLDTVEEEEEAEETPEVETSEKFKDLLTEGRFFRELHGAENTVDWFGFAEKIEAMKKRFVRSVKKARNRQIRALVYDLVRDGKPPDKVRPRFVDLIEKAFMEYQKEAYSLGITEVRKEKSKQLHETAVSLQEIPIPPELQEQFEFTAKVGAEEISQRTASSIKNQIITLTPQGLSARQMQARLFQDNIDTGERVIGGQFGKIVTAMGAGREIGAQVEGSEHGYYSAIMDGNTCAVCAAADEDFNAGTRDEPYELSELPPAPNPQCLGTINRCRCIHVYQFFVERGEPTP